MADSKTPQKFDTGTLITGGIGALIAGFFFGEGTLGSIIAGLVGAVIVGGGYALAKGNGLVPKILGGGNPEAINLGKGMTLEVAPNGPDMALMRKHAKEMGLKGEAYMITDKDDKKMYVILTKNADGKTATITNVLTGSGKADNDGYNGKDNDWRHPKQTLKRRWYWKNESGDMNVTLPLNEHGKVDLSKYSEDDLAVLRGELNAIAQHEDITLKTAKTTTPPTSLNLEGAVEGIAPQNATVVVQGDQSAPKVPLNKDKINLAPHPSA